MAFDNYECALRARNLLTEKSETRVDVTIPAIIAKIPTCLEKWARECFQSREKRELFKQLFSADLVAGVLDLSTYLDGTNGRINLKELRETTIYSQAAEPEEDPDETTDPNPTTETDDMIPCAWVSSMAQLLFDRPLGNDSAACYLEGSTLRTRDKQGSLVSTDTLHFTVTNFPAAVANIPLTLRQDFITYLAQMTAQELASGGAANGNS